MWRERLRLVAFVLFIIAVYCGTTQKGVDFLTENAKRSDVISLPSGLQYRVIDSGPTDAKSPGK